jgi:hypothetical protein
MERNGNERVESYNTELYIRKRKSRERNNKGELYLVLIGVYSPDYNIREGVFFIVEVPAALWGCVRRKTVTQTACGDRCHIHLSSHCAILLACRLLLAMSELIA